MLKSIGRILLLLFICVGGLYLFDRTLVHSWFSITFSHQIEGHGINNYTKHRLKLADQSVARLKAERPVVQSALDNAVSKLKAMETAKPVKGKLPMTYRQVAAQRRGVMMEIATLPREETAEHKQNLRVRLKAIDTNISQQEVHWTENETLDKTQRTRYSKEWTQRGTPSAISRSVSNSI